MGDYGRLCQIMLDYASARLCQIMLDYARLCEICEICEIIQDYVRYARLCKIMQDYARFCKIMQDYARLCDASIMRINVNICEPRNPLRGTFLYEICEIACDKECDDVSAQIEINKN